MASPERHRRKKDPRDRPIDPLTEDRSLLPPVESRLYGKIGVNIERDVSPNGKKLLNCIIEERADWNLLPTYADEDNFDLSAAVSELRALGLLDESNPQRLRLVSRPSEQSPE